MNISSDAVVAERLYASGDDQGLLDHAATVWTTHGSNALGSAEVARFARIAAFRSKSRDDDLWQARAVAAACITGAWGSLALSLQQYFFRLLAQGEHEAAAGVLDEMERLAQQEHEGPPDKKLVSGILAERRALLFAERGEWQAAADCYEEALALCPDGSRRFLKVKGGLARSRWLAGGDRDAAVSEFESLTAASEAFPDVHNAAIANLAAARAGDLQLAVPFDLI